MALWLPFFWHGVFDYTLFVSKKLLGLVHDPVNDVLMAAQLVEGETSQRQIAAADGDA